MPRYGFNFQWMFTTQRDSDQSPLPPDEKALDFVAKHGFNFVRIPTSYWFWVKDFKYDEPDESVYLMIDRYLEACQARGLHMSLNLHRAPGYCINGNDLEKHNLWLDEVAQEAFARQWVDFAERYKGISNADLSFDLINEPPAVGQYGMTRDHHAAVIRKTVAAIREVDPEREIVIDGLDGGHLAMPELGDLGLVHSGRGYQPQNVTHYLAEWWPDWRGQPEPQYPNTVYKDQIWNREVLDAYYDPWREVERMGNVIHMGEFGCYNKTPNDVALRWFDDLLSVWKAAGWGYGLWEFEGSFGIVNHGRPGACIEMLDGYPVDRDLFELLVNARTA